MGYTQRLLIGFSLIGFFCRVIAADTVLVNARKLEGSGEYKQATKLLTDALKKKGLPQDTRREYEWQIEWMNRVRQDYSLTEETLYQKLSAAVKGLTRSEFEAWLKEHRFDDRKIDGEVRYVGTSVSNLFWRHPDLNERRQPPKDVAAYHEAMLNNARRVKTAAADQKKPLVLPTHFKCTMTVTAQKNAAKDGAMIRGWLPIPRAYPFQTDFNLISSSSPVQYLAHDESPIRSVYLEQKAAKDQPTKFQISYEYKRNGIYFDLKSDEIKTGELGEGVKKYTEEGPHVKFTPMIRKLAAEISPNAADSLTKARAFYNWISENIKYSFAREYSTITNISLYCCNQKYGDCGQEGMLFITLCRLEGIPARWQSGWNLFPGHVGIHDWTEIYLAPYGWIPVDPWAGIYAIRYCTNLSEEERRELRDFYFGGLDQYRMSANCDHSQELQPPKHDFRSDDVDFQRGELESAKNIYFDKFDYELKVEEMTTEQ